VRSAEQTLAAANARIGVAKAAMYPSISLTGSLGGQSAAFSDLLLTGARIWSLGFGLGLPLFDAGRNAARVEQAEARQRQAVASYQKAVETAFREVADALSNLEQTRRTEASLALRLAAARGALEIARTRYQAGYSGYLEVLDAQRTANDAELAAVRSRQSQLAFSVDLFKALGGGWQGGQAR
jgi:multidrug efflux system outer membrane protein